ncbi:VQ motif-containing protein 17-like [Dioscorea cayenensis subsp. rotundata]|uniref:VQ motif-containing protein 17-like n=1 Tax=Dioscorea cayennensis subsp. rotundata TaxID=55577 RepID=A0AB40CPB9_DIOCR|nr:VQ motif-containing protein 17-like [Dioscorea cayenensis subsp. rotundata]
MEEKTTASDSCKIRKGTKMKVGMHLQGSHTISKLKPKIRIVHIFAPEIIKTDAANFRELVQKLTVGGEVMKKKKKKKKKDIDEAGDEMLWKERENEDGFLCGLGDVDGFLQGFANDYQFLPIPLVTSSQAGEIGEPHHV